MERHVKRRRDAEGLALVTALGLLALFAVLGMAWVDYMALEQREARLDVEAARARVLARAGLQAARGAVEAAIADGTLGEFLDTEHTIEFPAYQDTGDGIVEDANYRGEAKVRVADECARININFAPTAVLMKALGISGAKARQIRKSLPVPGKDGGKGRWFASVDELVTRGFLTEQQFAALNKEILTVDSVPDARKPVGFINVNTAPAEVLEAVLGVSPEVAEQVVAKRPFSSLAELSAAAGKDASTFLVKLDADDPNSLPKELAFESRCFRVVSRGAVIRTAEADEEEPRATKSVEAVITVGPTSAL
jgi:type II secretory pathway component PulK